MEIKKLWNSRFRPLILVLVLISILGVSLSVHFAMDRVKNNNSSSVAATDTLETNNPAPAENSPVLTEAQQKALNLYDQGLKLYYDKQFDSALALFNEALTLDPSCYQALNGKGVTYAFLGRYDEGISLIKQALEMKPDFVYAHFNLGLANELAGRWTEAINAYQDALNLDSKDVWSYYGIASIYGRQGNVDKVLEYLAPAIAIEPDVCNFAKEEKDFDPVKNDPRFQALLQNPPVISSKTAQGTPAQVPILYYHSIMVESGNELRMPPQQFEEQMQYLSQNGYQVITLDQLYNAYYNEGSLPAKPIAITFDDGYRDNFTNAFPIMQKYHFPGTVFMVSNFINQDGFLTSDQLQQLQAAGWTIGGHSENHTNLAQVSDETVIQELKNSRTTLESILGQPLKFMAYPFGGYNVSTLQITQADGYLTGFTTDRGWATPESDPYALHRIYCYANMGISEFARRITNPDY